jgi:hypothetical protein
MFIFYGEGLLAPRQTHKLEDHLLSYVRGCLFNVFPATLHTWNYGPPLWSSGQSSWLQIQRSRVR